MKYDFYGILSLFIYLFILGNQLFNASCTFFLEYNLHRIVYFFLKYDLHCNVYLFLECDCHCIEHFLPWSIIFIALQFNCVQLVLNVHI